MLAALPTLADANQRKKQPGEPFMTVFPLAGIGPEWWIADYDHPAPWIQSAWRKHSVIEEASGIRIELTPTPEGKRTTTAKLDADDGTLKDEGITAKKFVSGQVQRRKWYGYGRYEIVMQPAAAEGLITAFYVYTGPHFGDSHEEVDIEFLGRDTSKIHLNRFLDGKPMEDPVWKDLGFDASEKPRLYAFEWYQDRITWYVEGDEVFTLQGAEEVPRPPAKIYLDLWANGPGLASWAGEAQDSSAASALVQCVSFSRPNANTLQCSDITQSN